MQKKVVFIIICLTFVACGTGIKSGWNNFTAYYNTYYNAKDSYKKGYEKVKNSKVTYNAQQPIRIHEVPLNAGIQDFNKAIEKGAEILRKHGDSKWVDNSLSLIGKSYFFKKEYFSADQKFQELALTTQDESLVQESILWRSRVLLEMELYGQGTQYILGALESRQDKWNKRNRAQLKTILAEYYVQQENWEEAIIQLDASLPNLSSGTYQERGYFLLGQLNERINRFRDAYKAYSKVENYYQDYNLQYLALRKKAETARILGDDDSALDTFSKMVKDDKNTEFKFELDYEIARTYQNKNDYKEAEKIYKQIVKSPINNPSSEIKALSYYGLAEIYRFGYNDFEMAAAYYDTSSNQNASSQKLPENFDANELAVSFGAYADIKNEIQHKDSLLWVSNLSKPAFDSLLARIKREKIREIENARQNQEEQKNTLVNITGDPQNNSTSESNGFLNVNNPSLQNNAKTQFIAIWGSRPLADNWRVEELIKSSGLSANSQTQETSNLTSTNQTSIIDASIDLSEVPFEENQKVEIKKELAKLKYELGNLFYISLNMPDSAAFYFNEVIENHKNSQELSVSYYSLSEILNAQGKVKEAKEIATILADKFPGSRYTDRLAEKYDFKVAKDSNFVSQNLEDRYSIIKNDTSLTKVELAEKSAELALENVKQPEAAPILFEAIQIYIRIAKQKDQYTKNYKNYINSNNEFFEKKREFEEKKNTALVQLEDTSLTVSKRSELEHLVDSTLSEPDFSEIFPYYGEYWERSRLNINLFIQNFSGSKLITQVQTLKRELEKPLEENMEVEEISETDINEEPGKNLCSELPEPPRVRGGLESFIEDLSVQTSGISEVVYQLKINQRGIVSEYRLITNLDDKNVVSSFDNAIENQLVFEPVLADGEAVEVNCKFVFPVR